MRTSTIKAIIDVLSAKPAADDVKFHVSGLDQFGNLKEEEIRMPKKFMEKDYDKAKSVNTQ